MRVKVTTAAILLIGVISACGTAEQNGSSAIKNENEIKEEIIMKEVNLKENALEGLHAFVKDYDVEKAKTYFKEDYIQHNPGAPQGLSASLQMIPLLKQANTTVQTHRIFQDGDIIVMHNTLHNAAPLGGDAFVVFDVYRMEEGMVAEHWDAITPLVESTYGNTQVDGSTKIIDLDKTEANKKVASDLVNKVFINQNISLLSEYFHEDYIEHNPMSPGGIKGLMEGLQKYAEMGVVLKLEKLHKVLGEGNFVLAMIEASMNGQPTIIYDLYRMEAGKVAEHWDVIQPIPAEKANSNGVF